MPAIIATHELLQEARAAYHALMLGTSARELVDQNGEKVVYTPANKTALYNYIQQMESQLGVGCGGVPTPSAAYHPATFIF